MQNELRGAIAGLVGDVMLTIRILVIDDEIDIVEQQIKRLGTYFPPSVSLLPSFVNSVTAARAGLLNHESLDIVLLDIGYVDPKRDAIERIRETHPYVPVVMYSKHKNAKTILEYLDLGARTYIPKMDLPPDVLSESSQIRKESERKAGAIVDRIIQTAKEYRPVKRLLARSLESGTVRKSDARQNLEHQIAFLKDVGEVKELAPFFPTLGPSEVMERFAYYEMPFYEMKDLYKFLLGEVFRESCEGIAKRALADVIGGPFLQLSRMRRQTGITADIVPALFFDRFRSRTKEALEKLKAVGHVAEPAARDFGRLLECQIITIGKLRFKSPTGILESIALDTALCERLTPPFLSWIHGDLHFKNILIDDRLPKLMHVKLVDPRGTSVKEYPPGTGDPAYDLGKLLYSSRGFSHLIHDQIFRPPHGTLRFGEGGEAAVEPFAEFRNERAPIPGGLSTARLSAYRPTVQEWIRNVLADLGRYVKECVESSDYAKEDPHWYLRASLYEGLHCCSLAPLLIDENPVVATNLFLRGTELLNGFWDDVQSGGFKA